MSGTLQSESFTNNGVNAAGRFHADERPVENGTSSAGVLSIAYNAATQSYTISTAGRSATFAPADLVESGTSEFLSFEKIGATSDALTLTRPGTSGPLTYKYVAGGAWERATLVDGVLDFSYDPFTYGVETPDAALRRTGSGFYAVTLVGARAMEAPYAMAGTGTLQVDFLKGALTSIGTLTSIDSTGLIKSVGGYFGEAALSSTLNNFSGDFFMDDGKRFNGGWDGRFYGPNGEEVGAAWHLTSDDGEVAAGYLIGREDAGVAPLNDTLASLTYDESFKHRFSELTFTDVGGGNSSNPPDLLRSDGTISFDAALNQFTYEALDKETRFGPGDRIAGQSNSAIDVYQITDLDGLVYKLTLNKPGAGNPNIALTYTSFGHWERAQAPGSDRQDRWFAWGIRTNSFQIPAGTGHFDGIIAGTATRYGGGAIYALSGTSSFDMNFNSGSFTGALAPVGTSLADGSTRNFGSFSIGNGTIDVDAGLRGDVVNGSNAYLGFFEGALYGPKATEVGGTFGFQTVPTDTGAEPGASAAYLSGVVVAKRPGS